MKRVLKERVREDVKRKKGDTWLPDRIWRGAIQNKFDKGKGKGKFGKGKGKGKADKGKGVAKGDKGKQGKANFAAEMDSINKIKDTNYRCKFWNTSRGCAHGERCHYRHECYQCGDRNHRFVDKHM